MTQIRRILCPVDFSECSRSALSHAFALASRYKSEVIALHVLVPPPALYEGAPPYLPPDLLKSVDRTEVENRLRQLVAIASVADVRSQTLLKDGDAVKGILETAEAVPADIIVLGTHGHGAIEKLILGSVAEKVLRKAACPVLTIPPAAAPPQPGELFRNIICAIDFSDSSFLAMAYAYSLARGADARLTLAHVVESLPEEDPPQLAHFNVPEYRRLLLGDAEKRLEALLTEDVLPGRRERIVAAGKPYRQILRIAQEVHADLIVVGIRGRGPVDLALFGSTTNQLVRHAACPVLTVRSMKANEQNAFTREGGELAHAGRESHSVTSS